VFWGDQGLEEEDAMIGEKIEGNPALDAAMDEFRADFRYLVPLQEAANTGQIVLDARTAQQIENDNLKPNQNPDAYVFEKEEPEWDCETVVSTYSNLENHPKILDDDLRRIRLSKKSGIALGVLPERQSKKALAALLEEEEDEEEDEEDYRPNLGKKRSQKETPGEKKARKQAIKDEKRSRRGEKKGLRSEFHREETKQKNIKANNPRFGVSVKHLD
jgi:protein LTV1